MSSITKAVKKALPSVVNIVMSKGLKSFSKIKVSGGSGFIVEKNGIVLTNRHVVEDKKAEYLVILQDGEKIKPKILAVDRINDIAILKINKKNLPAIELGNSLKLELGEEVIAIGNALGLFKNTVSTGVISGLSREIEAQNELSQKQASLRGLIQTDAAINPGNSGGPLINTKGKAIGINAAMVFGAENIGFALPINNAKKDLQDFKKYGKIREPYLGFRYMSITEEIKEELNLPVKKGALIISEPDITQRNIKHAIIPHSPASKSGLKETDIILNLNNTEITTEKNIHDIIKECSIGEKLPLKILRKGKEKNLKIVLGEKS